MKPRTLIAIQFALWDFFFSSIIPFSGDILLPVVWLYDRRIFTGCVGIKLVQTAFTFPASMAIINGVIPKTTDLPIGWNLWLPPLALVLIAGSLLLETRIGAWYLAKKMRKLAPDIEVIRRSS